MVRLISVSVAILVFLVPQTAFAQQFVHSTLHQDLRPEIDTPYRNNLGEDERILGFSVLWAEAKHHFVFFDRLPGFDWDARYLEYLPKVRAANGALEYYRLLQRLCTELRDGHTVVRLPKELAVVAESVPAIQLARVEGKVVIGAIDAPALLKEGVKAGLEIVAVDGVPVDLYAAERVSPYYGDDHRTLHYLVGGPRGKAVSLQLREGSGPCFTRSLQRVRLSIEATAQMASPRFHFRQLADGIGYVALNTFMDGEIVDEFLAAFEPISRTNQLIIDLRNNHGGNATFSDRILACFTNKPVSSEIFESPLLMFGGEVGGGMHRTSLTHTIRPDGQRLYANPVVVLIGPHTASSAESFVVGFDSMHRGKLIGQRTAGSTGQPVMFSLPGRGTGSVVSMRVRYASGKEFMFTGIQPDLEVQPRVADILAGIDTVLQAAIEYFNH